MEAPSSSAYHPFPDVSEWPTTSMDMSAVDRLKSVVDQLASEPPSVLKSAVDAVKRVAAVETGAIENLYEHDRGITITAAMSAAAIDALRQGSGQQKHAYIKSQLEAYDYVLDLVTHSQSITEVRVRELHTVLCASQKTYVKYGPNGEKQDVPLPKGRYKIEDNHVLLKDATVHRYAPQVSVSGEMERFVQNLVSPAFEVLHPVDQAAYLHYAFVAIHPFADGNGRVARALTSIPTYRHYRVPILITFDQRDRYFDALEAADAREFDLFRMFVRNRIAESIEFLELSIQNAKAGTLEQVAERIAKNNVTRGGYSHVLVDEAALALLTTLEQFLNEILGSQQMRPAGVNWAVSRPQADRDPTGPEHRRLISSAQYVVQIQGICVAPAVANWAAHVGVEIPIDASGTDTFRLECGNPNGPHLELAVSDVVPNRAVMTDMKLRYFSEALFKWVGAEVERLGAEAIVKRGYVRR
jgi:Fic family protein